MMDALQPELDDERIEKVALTLWRYVPAMQGHYRTLARRAVRAYQCNDVVLKK